RSINGHSAQERRRRLGSRPREVHRPAAACYDPRVHEPVESGPRKSGESFMKSGFRILAVLLLISLPLFVACDATARSAAERLAERSMDWPQFRGPTGMGTSGETGLPVTWSATENIAWKTDLPGAGTSCPILVGDRIFVACYSGYNVP